MTFVLSENFNKKHQIADLELSTVLLDDNADYPWFILIPKVPNVSEILDLNTDQRLLLWKEVELIAKYAKENLKADKLNIATIGNVTPQLHVHVIARFKNDPSWPKTIWGVSKIKSYQPEQVSQIRDSLASYLQ